MSRGNLARGAYRPSHDRRRPWTTQGGQVDDVPLAVSSQETATTRCSLPGLPTAVRTALAMRRAAAASLRPSPALTVRRVVVGIRGSLFAEQDGYR